MVYINLLALLLFLDSSSFVELCAFEGVPVISQSNPGYGYGFRGAYVYAKARGINETKDHHIRRHQ